MELQPVKPAKAIATTVKFNNFFIISPFRGLGLLALLWA